MSQPPQAIQIGPYRFTVEEDKRLTEANNCYGRIDYTPQIIAIYPEMSQERTAAVLLHELLHGLWDLSHLGGYEGDEEKTITALAPALLDTLRRNPDLVRYIMAEMDS